MYTETKNETFRVSHRWSRHELISGPKDPRERVLRGLVRNDLLRAVSAYIEGYVEDFTVNHDDPFYGPSSCIQVCISSVPVRTMVSYNERADLEARIETAEGRNELLRSTNMQLLADAGYAESSAEGYRRDAVHLWNQQNHWLVKLAIRVSGWFSRKEEGAQ
jgi:hypothetical protein